jgi:hypothetical protein
MNYQERLKAQLVKYKFRVLGVTEPGVWTNSKTGLAGRYPHILPAERLELNILAPYRARFWSEFRRPEAPGLHTEFGHLNSSQAMCFNLFYPLTVERAWAQSFVQGVLGLKDAAPQALAFEHVPDADGQRHYDFFIRREDGAGIYFETRLAELVPGNAGRARLQRLMRELDQPGNLLFVVLPKANESLNQALRALSEVERLRLLYLEDAMEKARALLRGRDEALKEHYREFRQKYLFE